MHTAVIIDDSPVVRLQLRQILSRIDVTVVAEAGTGDQALPLYEQHRPDLITLDVVMPVKDGVTAAIELLRAFPEARVVMCTLLTTRDKIMTCQRAGVTHYVLKPFDTAHTTRVFQQVLSRADGAPPGGAL